MTAQNVWQIALVTGAACLFIGYIGCSLFDLYRKGRQCDLEKWLDAEVEQGVKLLKENETLKWKLSTVSMFKAYSPLYLEPGKTYALEYDEEMPAEVAEFIIENCQQRTGANFLIFAGGIKLKRKPMEGFPNFEVAAEFSIEGTEGGASDNPGHVDNAGASSSNWNCEDQGHRYGITNEDGETKRRCLHCPQDGGSAA